MNYLEAYRARLERNQSDLIQLIKDVQQKDPLMEAYVYDYPNRLLSGVVFIRGEYINSIQFHEVPYRWSGCKYHEFGNSHGGGENSKMPFSADDVLNTMKPINTIKKSSVEIFKNKEHYLNWYSYLNLYTPIQQEKAN